MTIQRLHHAQITIPTGEEDAARAFYCDVLDLREIEKPESLRERGGFWLQLDDVEIHVGTEPAFDRTQTKAHLAYQVSDLAHWRRTLTDAGIAIKESIPIAGYHRFECRDPFGNRVEMIQLLEE